MGELYECDAGCGKISGDLKGWIIVDRIGHRGKLLLCSERCHALQASQAALEAEERAPPEAVEKPRRRWWSRGRHGD